MPPQTLRTVQQLRDFSIEKDVYEMSDSDRQTYIKEVLRKYENSDTYVFFLNNDDDFEAIVSEGLKFCEIKKETTLVHAVTTYNNLENFRNKIAKRKQQTERYKGNQTDKDENKRVSGAENNVSDKSKGNESPIVKTQSKDNDKGDKGNINTSQKKTDKVLKVNKQDFKKPDDTEKKQENTNLSDDKGKEKTSLPNNIKVVNENDTDALGDVISELSDGSDTSVAEINGDKSDKDDGKEIHSSDNKDKEKKDNGSETSTDDIFREKTLDEIEKEIFLGDFKSGEVVRKYTDLDNSKARTAELTFERFIRGLNGYIAKEVRETLTKDDYRLFLITILKAYSYKDFVEGWKTLNAFEIELDEREFNYIKDEANYYSDMCKMFYATDKW